MVLMAMISRLLGIKTVDLRCLWWVMPDNTDPVVVVNTDGRIEVFMVGNDNVLYHRWQTKSGGSWV